MKQKKQKCGCPLHGHYSSCYIKQLSKKRSKLDSSRGKGKEGYKVGYRWIQSREFKTLAEIMNPPVKTRNLNGECPKCGGASDGNVYMSSPPQKKRSICGNFWSYWIDTVGKL